MQLFISTNKIRHCFISKPLQKMNGMGIDINHSIFLFGDNYYGQLGLGENQERNIKKAIQHPLLSNIIDISSKGLHTFVKTSSEEIYAFGYDRFAQLGIDIKGNKQLTPIQVFQNNDLWCSNTTSISKAKSASNSSYEWQ